MNTNRILFKYINLAEKLNTSIESINEDYFLKNENNQKSLYSYFCFIKNLDYLNKVEEIYDKLILLIDKKNIPILDFKKFTNEEKILFFSICIFKSLKKISNTPIPKDIFYINSDLVLNANLSSYKNLIVFYNIKHYENDVDYKKKMFKIISFLVEDGVIKEEITKFEKKTIKEWSLGFNKIEVISTIDLNISTSPFKLIHFDNQIYLKGDFFTKTYKVFRENVRSGEKFKLRDDNYLEKLIENKCYINKKDLKDVINIVEKENNFNEESLIDEINQLYLKIIDDLKIIKKNTKKILENEKKEIFKNIDVICENKNLDEILCNLLLNFLFDSKEDILNNKVNYTELTLFFMEIFKKNFIEPENKKIFFKKLKKINLNEEFYFDDYIDNDFQFEHDSNKINIYSDNNEIEKKTQQNPFNDFLEEDFSYNDKKVENNKIDNLNLLDFVTYYSRKEIESILKKNKKKIEDLLNIKKKKQNEVKMSNLNENIYIKKKLVFVFLKLKTSKDFKIFFEKKKKMTHFSFENMKKNASHFSKLIVYNNLYILNKLIFEENQLVYFPFYFDFRGRLYYDSPVSPTFFKFSRYIINYGNYSKEDLEQNQKNKISPIIEKYEKIIKNVKTELNINKNFRKIDESVFWCLISIGKIKIEKDKVEISVEDILKTGLNLLKEKEFCLKLIDKIELMHYKKILHSFNDENPLKRCLLKDATASFIQNLIRLMGYKNKESLKYANLTNSDFWYDTYSFILNKWLEKEKNLNILIEKTKKIFNRKTIKKTVMTSPYAATYLTAFNYFKEAVEENFNIKIEFKSEEEYAFKRFYNFIKEDVENKYFLKHNSKDILEYIKSFIENDCKTGIKIETHDSETNLIYYKLIPKNYDLEISIPHLNVKKRITKRYEILDKLKIDLNKVLTAIRANWVHYIDALLVRDINRNSKQVYLTIHDCFLVDFLSISDFIIIANEQSNVKIFENFKWNKENYENFFSIFIFL